MDATSNPQTAAEQARKNYQDVTTPGAAVPENVRAMVEKAVDQSREVYDRSKDALDASVATLERTFDAAGQGAVAFNRRLKIERLTKNHLKQPKSLTTRLEEETRCTPPTRVPFGS